MNIRVSEEEFESLREACGRMGTRNVSELARDAMRLILDEHRVVPINGRDTMTWLNELDGRLISLQAEVKRLQALLNANS